MRTKLARIKTLIESGETEKAIQEIDESLEEGGDLIGMLVAKADEEYGRDGEIEVDDDALVSMSWEPGDGDGGAYVQAWVYVTIPEEEEEEGKD